MVSSSHPLLGDDFCSLEGPFPIALTGRGTAAKKTVLQKLAQNEYELEATPCLCGGNKEQLVATVDRYRIPHRTVVCLQCGLVRTNPRLTAASYADFYTHHYRAIYEREGHDTERYFASHVALGRERARFIRRHTLAPAENATILEIGCGGGWNLMPFHEADWKAFGWDFDTDYLAQGTQRGLLMRQGSLDEAVDAGVMAHVIILSHVAEHFLDPVADLIKLRSLLHPAGVLFVEVPSLFEVTGNLLRYFQNAHTFSFVPETLERVMKAAGYRRVAMSPAVQSLWVCSTPVPYPTELNPRLVRKTLDYLWRRQKQSVVYMRYRGALRRANGFVGRLSRPCKVALG